VQDETSTVLAKPQNERASLDHLACSLGPHTMCEGFLNVDLVPALEDAINVSTAPLSLSPASSATSTELVAFDIGNIPQCMSVPASGAPPNIPLLSPAHQPHYPITFAGALYINGQILDIPCSTVVPAKSKPAGPEIPLPLQPTELQLITIHETWIDRFPFPKMRNSLISLSGVIDGEEFVRDMMLMPSFEIVPGRLPWDPRAWKILKPFAQKWGYLFFGEG
jgi:hypothetical protein